MWGKASGEKTLKDKVQKVSHQKKTYFFLFFFFIYASALLCHTHDSFSVEKEEKLSHGIDGRGHTWLSLFSHHYPTFCHHHVSSVCVI